MADMLAGGGMKIFKKRLPIGLALILSVMSALVYQGEKKHEGAKLADETATQNVNGEGVAASSSGQNFINLSEDVSDIEGELEEMISLDTVETSLPEVRMTDADEREIAVMLWDLQHIPPEPDDFNYDAEYGGPFEDQVRIVNMDDECTDNCAEVLTERIPALGEYADQVNSEALTQKAKAGGLADEVNSIPLLDPDSSTGPPVD